jgi:hypothetical protein
MCIDIYEEFSCTYISYLLSTISCDYYRLTETFHADRGVHGVVGVPYLIMLIVRLCLIEYELVSGLCVSSHVKADKGAQAHEVEMQRRRHNRKHKR